MSTRREPYVDIAVPLPLPGPLTYRVPDAFGDLARPGSRARVTVGKRRMVGVVVASGVRPPDGVSPRPLEAVVDLEPLLPPDLLDLASFVAEYYMAPIGEVLRIMLPQDLPPWGDRRIWLTDAGALATPRSAHEQAVVTLLRDEGRMRLADLRARLGLTDLETTVAALAAGGRVALSEGERRGQRYQTAVELAPGAPESLLERCGRSAPGRQVVEYLLALGRPATLVEIRAAVGCSPGVVRRLVSLGVLRRFSQIARLSLDHQLLRADDTPPFELRPDQSRALAALEDAIDNGRYAAFALTGVTGSGKTEVYLRAAAKALQAGRSAVLLVPEIALVPALARTARQSFGDRLAILHSGLGASERHQEWERIRSGQARVVLGPRSAVFGPVRNPGLLVVDEEQDPSYKQDQTPRYHGRDLALLRGQRAGAVVVVVSATPSLETRRNLETGKISPLLLTRRVGQGQLPEGILVDLRSERPVRRRGEIHFSSRLLDELRAVFRAGDQAILLRNRRGYSPLLLCRACGEDLRCRQCGLPRTYHRRPPRLLCHYCGSSRQVPERCTSCGEQALEPVGAGTERVEEAFGELFPEVTADLLDRDAVQRKGGAAAVLERFSRGTTQVLIGTQMVSKGHHFPRVALTAVLLADTYLGFPDFRAVERTYTLLTQLAGRAGRGEREGRVVIQTYHPEHYAIQAALSHDDDAFEAEEMRFRRTFHYPPFARMVQLLSRDRNRQRAESRLLEIAAQAAAHPRSAGLRVSGPAPAPLERLRGKWRFQLLLRGPSGRQIRELLADVLPERAHSDLVVDVDPYELL